MPIQLGTPNKNAQVHNDEVHQLDERLGGSSNRKSFEGKPFQDCTMHAQPIASNHGDELGHKL
jgi:hypothetical protein